MTVLFPALQSIDKDHNPNPEITCYIPITHLLSPFLIHLASPFVPWGRTWVGTTTKLCVGISAWNKRGYRFGIWMSCSTSDIEWPTWGMFWLSWSTEALSSGGKVTNYLGHRVLFSRNCKSYQYSMNIENSPGTVLRWGLNILNTLGTVFGLNWNTEMPWRKHLNKGLSLGAFEVLAKRFCETRTSAGSP